MLWLTIKAAVGAFFGALFGRLFRRKDPEIVEAQHVAKSNQIEAEAFARPAADRVSDSIDRL